LIEDEDSPDDPYLASRITVAFTLGKMSAPILEGFLVVIITG
jgi:hypothetical protein